MSGVNEEGIRIKMEPVVGDDEDTRHLYCSESESSEDVKPTIKLRPEPSISGCIELSSDEDVPTPTRPPRKKRKRSSFFIRLVVKEVATQTDGDAETKDASINTDDIPKADLGVNTDKPPETAEIAVGTDDVTEAAEDEQTEVDEQEPQTSSTKGIYYQCTLCSCYYLSFNLLQKHSRSQHNKPISEQPKVSYNSNCKFCSASYVFATYNKHIKTKHAEKFTKSGAVQKSKLTGPYECTLCNIKFLSYNEGKRHRKVHGDIEKKFVLRKVKTGDTSAGTTVKSERRQSTAHKAPIPKNVLFECPKCKLNFFFYRNGLRHKIACERGDNTRSVQAKCTKCEKTFLQVHIKNHDLQHDMTTVFQVVELVDGMEHKIMYRCMKCKLCMEERACRLHFQCGCAQSSGVPCTVCNLKVDRQFMSKHKEAHAHMGLTRDDIVLVDVCDF